MDEYLHKKHSREILVSIIGEFISEKEIKLRKTNWDKVSNMIVNLFWVTSIFVAITYKFPNLSRQML